MSPQPEKKKRFVYLLAVAFRRVQAAVGVEGKSAARAGLLMAIGPERGTPMAEVGKTLDAAAPALSNLVERAARDGLVERRADPADGRAWVLVLTAAGRAARARAVEEARALNARLTDGFDGEELAVVARWLETVSDRFRKTDERRGEES